MLYGFREVRTIHKTMHTLINKSYNNLHFQHPLSFLPLAALIDLTSYLCSMTENKILWQQNHENSFNGQGISFAGP